MFKPQKVLILGSGALKIGQAGEFDYSGSQALKALKEEGIQTVLINPNIATVQTDQGMADQVYFLPINPYFVEEIIKKEKIEAILLSFGGQTALNCGLELDKNGVLTKYGVQVLGTPISAIRDTEDRHLFAKKLEEIGVNIAKSQAIYTPEEAVKVATEIGFPVMMRSGFSLGGKGSAIVHGAEECKNLAEIALKTVPQILIEECLKGWKEVEYEVVRDGSDNCITVCNMENFDPMGIHTGESIVVAPTQTLDDFEVQLLRDVAIKTIRHLGIIGECNIQYALHPKSRRYCVIEVNARLSRSSALASKATGYPLAYVAAKIALGYDLPDIPNSITKKTSAFFEPALDYIICKFPRWDLDKFENVDQLLGTEMKSVGEVMAIGRSFAEVIQKAVRMLEVGIDGLESDKYKFDDIIESIRKPTPKRLFAIANALAHGMTVKEIGELTGIDLFFLHEIERIVTLEQEIKGWIKVEEIDYSLMLDLKRVGFSDKSIGKLVSASENTVRNLRRKLGIRPHLSQIDTLAAEYPAETNFLYFTYFNVKSDIQPSDRKKIMVLGSGCYRIGASVEFDWCAMNAITMARKLGYETIMLNYNPETVSTDYDMCDNLVFDEISLEIILELNDFMHPEGVIVSMGGQTSNNLALMLYKENVTVLGTHPTSIDKAEDRNKFSSLLDFLNIEQPLWAIACSIEDLKKTIQNIGGFPVLVRPSYVLSGAAMRVAYSIEDLKLFIHNAANISNEYPVVISKFEENAREVECDGIAQDGNLIKWVISEHIENAGVHSGDATIVLPPQTLSKPVLKRVQDIANELAKKLEITGPFNLQMLVKDENVKVIECNLRASRSFPFISKALGTNLIADATLLMLGKKVLPFPNNIIEEMNYVVVKSPQFSFSRLKGTDPRLGVEMASTGEVACFGNTFNQALLAAVTASGFKTPKKGILLSLEIKADRYNFLNEAQIIRDIGLSLYATPETAKVLQDAGIECISLDLKKLIYYQDTAIALFLNSGKVDLIISVPGIARVKTTDEGYLLRSLATALEISLITDISLSKAIINMMASCKIADIPILSWQEYLQNINLLDKQRKSA